MNVNEAIQSALENYQAGNLKQAEIAFKNILEVQANNITAINLLGIIHYQNKNYNSAIQYMKISINLNPNNAQAYYIIGHSMQEKGQLDEASTYYQKTLEREPNFTGVHYNLGTLFQDKKRYDEAISCYQKALQLNPNDIDSYYNLGRILQDKKEFEASIACYQKALQLNPNLTDAYNNIGIILQEKEQFDEAIVFLQKALQLNPNLAETYNNLGCALKEKRQFDEATVCYRNALKINTNFSEAYNNLGCVLMCQGKLNQAELYYRRAVQIEPSNASYYSNLLFSMNYDSRYDAQTICKEHIQFAKQIAEPLSSAVSPHSNLRNPRRRLKIGYISPDLRRHAVAYFIEPILVAHNREHFEIFCYSNSLKHDEVTERIQKHTDHWCKIAGMSDEEVAEQIRKDKIDILVDLAGHTAGNRILVFARKPSPIQISWIGYLATTGLSTMDYKIVDRYTDPPGKTEQYYTEKLIRLPESFLCYLPDRDSPEVVPLPAMSTGHITFGSFNNFAKVTPEVFTLWAKVLNELPDSRLVLKGKSFYDKTTCQYTRHMFVQRGIAAERIVLQLPDPSPEHLESYNQIDIGLDTFPFNGATTTCEALWMGVPVVTLAGTAFHASAGVSLLSNVGLPNLVAKTLDEYISIAVNLAKDLQRLKSLRENLRNRMSYSPLCDAERFTTNLEICYRNIWDIWCKSI